MSRRVALPLLAGLVAAAAAFAVTASVGGDDPAPRAAARAVPQGRAVFARMGCGSCHRLAAAGSAGEIGPSLDERLPHHTRDSLRSVIVNPPGGGVMPDDFGARLDPGELDALVGFLVESRSG
jgi:mono/diheme cytochrome c family protein